MCRQRSQDPAHRFAAMLETIFTVSHDFVLAVYTIILMVLDVIFQEEGCWPEWLASGLSTDDLPDAYRAHSVQPDQ